MLLADSGHANGTPEKDEILRYRSVGGYFMLIANPEILEDKPVRANILSFYSGQTKRVCRSTLAAEASHLAEAVEAGDWCCCLLEEALNGSLNLKDWPSVTHKRRRVYVTDARSVYDCLQKDATSTSTDKRMAIEGALLRETIRQPNTWVRWIDGMQNVANVLTKANAEKETLREFPKEGMMSLVQSEANRKLKEKKRLQRQKRSVEKTTSKSSTVDVKRRQQLAAEIAEADGDSSSSQQNKNNQWEIYHWVGLRLQLLMFDWCGEKLMSWLEAWRWLVDLVSLPAQETAVLSAHDRHGQVHDRSAGLDALFGNTCSTMTSRWSTWEDRFAMCFTKCILLF